jgi:hypothetical protein
MFSFQSELFYLAPVKLTYIEIEETLLKKTAAKEAKSIYHQRFIIHINNSEKWHAGVVALGEGKGYITVKQAILKKNGLKRGDIVTVNLEIDDSEFGMPIPEELTELLSQDEDGKKRFDALPLGKKRYIIYYINQVKSSDKKLERAVLLISNLKLAPLGKEEFRFLLGKN